VRPQFVFPYAFVGAFTLEQSSIAPGNGVLVGVLLPHAVPPSSQLAPPGFRSPLSSRDGFFFFGRHTVAPACMHVPAPVFRLSSLSA